MSEGVKAKLFEKYCRLSEKPSILRAFYESFNDVQQRVALAKRLSENPLLTDQTRDLLKTLIKCDSAPGPAEILAKSCEISGDS